MPAEWIGLHSYIVCARPDETHFESSYVLNGWIVNKNLISHLMRCIALQWHDHIAVAVVRFDIRMLSFVIPFVFGIQTLCESVGLQRAVIVSYRMFSHLFTFTFVITLNMRASLLSFVLAKFCMTFEIIQYKVIKNRHIDCTESAIQS